MRRKYIFWFANFLKSTVFVGWIFTFVVFFSTKTSAISNEDISNLCDKVTREVSVRVGVPELVLSVISLVETGRKRGKKILPWPWTVNMEGEGVWFESKEAAQAYVGQKYANGARSFDVGCFQLNYKWHGKGFSSIDEMFDPYSNALYAALFLKSLYVEKGNWIDAVGAYHSRTPKYAEKYKAKFSILYTSLNGSRTPESGREMSPTDFTRSGNLPSNITSDENGFPLLWKRTSNKSTLGSLFPEISGNGSLWGGG